MAIVINGSGTVTGITAGGLPDGCVDADTLASSGTFPAWNGSNLTGLDADLVKISSTSFSNAGAVWLNASNFPSGYTTFKIHLFAKIASGTGSGGRMYMRISEDNTSSWVTSTVYSWSMYHGYSSWGANTTATQSYSNDSQVAIAHDGIRDTLGFYELEISHMHTSDNKLIHYRSVRANHDGADRATWDGGSGLIRSTSSSNNALQFFHDAGNLTGNYMVYGRK